MTSISKDNHLEISHIDQHCEVCILCVALDSIFFHVRDNVSTVGVNILPVKCSELDTFFFSTVTYVNTGFWVVGSQAGCLIYIWLRHYLQACVTVCHQGRLQIRAGTTEIDSSMERVIINNNHKESLK